MELKFMINFYFCLLFFLQVCGQENLSSISSCLNNCLTCKNDELAQCSGQQHIECVKGYMGESCALKENFGYQLVMFDSDKSNSLQKGWKSGNISQCNYNRMNKQIKINVLGIYHEFDFNEISIEIKPWFQSFIVYFNLIRDAWTPYTDLLRVANYDQQQSQINQYFIEFQKRDSLDPQINRLRCNKQPFLIQKYSFQGAFQQNQKKMIIKFQGMMFSEAKWALSNVKVTLGCSKLIIYDGTSCQICQKGYYPVRNTNKTLERCNICSIYCTQCISSKNCVKCQKYFNLINGQCLNNNTKLSYPVPGDKLYCGQKLLYLSKSQGSLQKIEISLQSISQHDKIRVHFHLFYVISSQLQVGLVTLLINQKNQILINGSQLFKQRYPNQKCQGFGQNQYYSIKKVVSDYIDHKQSSIRVVIQGKSIQRFGLQNFFIQFNNSNIGRTQEVQKTTSKQQRLLQQNNLETQPSQQKKLQQLTEKPIKEQPKPQSVSANQSIRQASNGSQPKNEQININEKEQIKTKQQMNSTFQQKNLDIMNNTQIKQVSDMTKFQNQSIFQIKKLRNILQNLNKIMNLKQKIVFGLKYGQQLTITVLYPVQVELFPFIVGHFSKRNVTLVPSVTKQTKNYQQLTFNVKQSFLDQIITLRMSQQNPIKTHKRLLQSNNQIGKINVYRYDYLNLQEKAQFTIFCVLFQYIAWIAIVSVIFLSLFGTSVLVQQFVLLLQIIFLHIYIFSQYLPINFRIAISGLKRIQNLNYFSQWIANLIQNLLLDSVVQNSPIRFVLFKKDINFSRAVYPCVFISFVYLISFLILKLLKRLIQPRLYDKNVEKIDRMKKAKLFVIRIAERSMNFWYQVWQYQYLTFIWAACLQMHNFFYPQGSNRSQASNLIFCLLCVLLALSLPIITYIYLNRRFYSRGYFDYCYLYDNIFYLRLPSEYLPSRQHRIEILLKNLRYIFISVSIAFIGIYPLVSIVILSIINLLAILYTNFTHVQINILAQKLNVTEYLLLMFLEATILLSYGTSISLEKDIYLVIGYVSIAISLLLVFTALIRVIYYSYQKFKNPKVRNKILDVKHPEGTGQTF